MAIYKYTLIKYLKSWSTWIIAGTTFCLIFFLAGFVAFSNFDPNDSNATRKYAVLIISLVAGITAFLAIFTSVFAGFKSASMFKDEVEDGTFLVMLSKPITRSKLILFKWLALLTMLVLYTLIVSLSLLLTVLVFDNGYKVDNLNLGGVQIHTLRSSIVLVSLIMWGILTVVALIFSSIALLLSTKLSVGTTIGISIALGVIIPITSLVSIFTKKPEFKSITSTNVAALDEIMKRFDSKEKSPTKDAKTLYSVGISTGDVDSYRKAFVADLNFQISVLSSYASDRAIPAGAKSYTTQTFSGPTNTPGLASGNYVKASEQGYFTDPTGSDKFIELKEQLLKSAKYTWEKTSNIRNQLIVASSIASLMMKPNDKVPQGFITTKKLFNFYLPADYKSITDAEKGPAIELWSAVTTFLSTETAKLMNPNSGLSPLEKSKIQADLLSLIDHMQYKVRLNKYNFTVIPKSQIEAIIHSLNPQADIKEIMNKVSFMSAGDEVTIDSLLYILSYLGWLSTPLNVISENAINQVFTDSKLKMSDEAKYLPLDVKKEDVTVDNMVDFLINKKNNKLYKEIMILFDNGYEIKRIEYEDYVNRKWLLLIYIGIAFALVPFTYLMIRKQDYR